MLKWACCALAGIYLFLYPSILLVPEEYRQGFWSSEYNVRRQGIFVNRAVYETKSVFQEKVVYRVQLLVNGSREFFWAANDGVMNKMKDGDLVQFETRGRVIVLANTSAQHSPIVSLLNY